MLIPITIEIYHIDIITYQRICLSHIQQIVQNSREKLSSM